MSETPAGPPQVADVYIVRTDSLAGRLVMIGAVLRRLPAYSHVAVMHHVDEAGIPWGVEGRPGGVGWVDMRGYTTGAGLLCNAAQPRTEEQRYLIAVALERILGTKYDWPAIFHDAMRDLGLPELFAADWEHGVMPGQVVCSAVAAWAHDQVGLARPDRDVSGRFIQPSQWAQFVLQHGWAT